MSNIIEDLLDIIHKRKLTIPKFSKETGIPVDRIYQWKKGNGKPKAEDAEIIKKWLQKTEEVTGGRSIQDATDALINMLILEIAKLKSKVLGISVDDAIDELEQNARIALRQIEKGA